MSVKSTKLFLAKLKTKNKATLETKEHWIGSRSGMISDFLDRVVPVIPAAGKEPDISDFVFFADPTSGTNVNSTFEVTSLASRVGAMVAENAAGSKFLLTNSDSRENWHLHSGNSLGAGYTSTNVTPNADGFFETTTNAAHELHRALLDTPIPVGVRMKAMMRVKPRGNTRWAYLYFEGNVNAPRTWFDLSGNGAVGTATDAQNSTIVKNSDNSFTCEWDYVFTAINTTRNLRVRSGGTGASPLATFAGVITDGLDILERSFRRYDSSEEYIETDDIPIVAGLNGNTSLYAYSAKTNYLDFGPCPLRAMMTSDSSLVAVLKPFGATASQTFEVVGCREANVSGWSLYLEAHASSGFLRAVLVTSQAAASTSLVSEYCIQPNKLNVIIFKLESGTGSLYLNGARIATGAITAAFPALKNLRIGLGWTGLNGAWGQIAPIGFIDQAFSDSEIKEWMLHLLLKYDNKKILSKYKSVLANASLIYDPEQTSFILDGAIKSANNLANGFSNLISQATAANRPLMSRSDTVENFLLYSEEANQALGWSASLITVTANATLSPNGTPTADKLIETAATGMHRNISAGGTFPTITGVSYSCSIYAKAAERDRVNLRFNNGGGDLAVSNFDLLAGTVISSTVGTATIEDVGDGWFRCTVIGTSAATGNASLYINLISTGTTTSYLGDITKGLYVWGAQGRRSSSASTYIQTTTIPVVAGINGLPVPVFNGGAHSLPTSLAVNPTGGMWGVAMVKPNALNVGFAIFFARTSAATDRFFFQVDINGSIACRVYSSATAYIGRTSPIGSVVAGVATILAFTYDGTTSATGIKIYKDGIQVDNTTVSSGVYSVPTAGTTLVLGNNPLGTAANGYLDARFFGQGNQKTDVDREELEGYLRKLYITGNNTQITEAPDSTPVYGVLREINGLGQDVSNVLPADKYGSIDVDVTRGTIDHDKRFYDLFERESVIQQEITIYSLEKHPDIPAEESDLQVEFKGVVTSIGVNSQSKLMKINFRSEGRFLGSPNPIIDNSDFPQVQSSKYAPLVFFQAEVIPVFVENSSFNWGSNVYQRIDNKFIFAAEFESFKISSVNLRYLQNKEQFYSLVNLPFTANPNLVSSYLFLPYGTSTPKMANEFHAHSKWADDILKLGNVNKNRLLTHIETTIALQAGAGVITTQLKPTLSLQILEKLRASSTPSDIKEGEATISMIAQTTPPFLPLDLGAKFNQPCFLYKDDYFIYFKISDGGINLAEGRWGVQVLTENLAGQSAIIIEQENNQSSWAIQSAARNKFIIEFYSACVTDQNFSYQTNSGYLRGEVISFPDLFAPTFVTANWLASGDFSAVDLSTLKMVYDVYGLLDDSLGTITGTPSVQIFRADHIVKFLYYLSTGSLDGLDFTTFSPGDYAPNLAGATEGRQLYKDILTDILFNSASKLIPRGADLALWSYGLRQDLADVITESDCTLLDFEIEGENGIVNKVEVNFDKSALPLSLADLQQGDLNYKQNIVLQNDQSIALCGVRELDIRNTFLDYVKDPAVAEKVAQYWLDQFAFEQIYLTFSVPYWKYKHLLCWDIVKVSHIDLPSHAGSQSSNTEIQLTTDGESLDTSFSLGEVWRRANEFDMRIVSRTPNYNVNEEEATLVFKVKVLNNPNEIY